MIGLLVIAVGVVIFFYQRRPFKGAYRRQKYASSNIKFKDHDDNGYYDFSDADEKLAFHQPLNEGYVKSGGATHEKFGPLVMTLGAPKRNSMILAAVFLVFPAFALVLGYMMLSTSPRIDFTGVGLSLVFFLAACLPSLYFLSRPNRGIHFYRYGFARYNRFTGFEYAYSDIRAVKYEKEFVDPHTAGPVTFFHAWSYQYCIMLKNGKKITIDSDGYMNRRKLPQFMAFWLENLK